jgi:capsid assembly protease
VKIQELRRALSGKLWFVHEQKFNEMLAFAELACSGGAAFETMRAHFEACAEFQAARARTVTAGAGAVAVVPLYGMLAHRGSFWSMYFGGATVENLTDQLRQAVNDPLVSAIVLDVDSPGGDVEGIDELASEIYAARKQKPITAISNSLCASAAYYLASQASEIMVSPSSLTGSIGVYTAHEDDSKFLDDMGVKITLIKYGENKAEGNPYEPLSDPARDHMQDMVNTFGEMFDKAVARGRGMKAEDVHNKFGQGRVFDAKKAVAMGMADKVGTFDDALIKHGVTRTIGARKASIREHVFIGELISAGIDANGNFVQVFAAEKKTKRVDGEDLEKSAFAYAASDKLEDWKLPIEFSDEEKTKSHIRNAIARWSSTDMPDKDEKEKARGRIKAAAKKHGIELADGDLQGKGSKKKADDTEDDQYADAEDVDPDSDGDGDCACACAKCKDGDCKACSCKDCACEGCACDSAAEARKKAKADDGSAKGACQCACAECKGGKCAECSCKDCACDGCACDAATAAKKKAKQAIARRRLEMEAV